MRTRAYRSSSWSKMGPTHHQQYWVDANGCWRWRGALNAHGYGVVSKKSVLAHRLFYEQFIAHPIPDGKQVNHLCDVPDCVNPSHLVLGTNDTNIRDKISKNRQARGSAIASSKLTEDTVRIIRNLRGKLSYRAIALRFGVSAATVSMVLNNQRWAHVPDNARQL